MNRVNEIKNKRKKEREERAKNNGKKVQKNNCRGADDHRPA